jgi:CheY-like chemotaxis protein
MRWNGILLISGREIPADSIAMISRFDSSSRKKSKPRAPRILVVDDQWCVRDYLKLVIRHWRADALIICRAKGEAAWEVLQRTPPDFLITDMSRCGLDGYQMLRRLARWRARVPILVISGLATEEEVRNCAGSDLEVSFLSKPFDIPDVIAELSRHLGPGDKARTQRH